MVSYRDTRDRGGKVIYNLLLLGLGVTLPYMETGLSMTLGEVVVVKVKGNVVELVLYFCRGIWRTTALQVLGRIGNFFLEKRTFEKAVVYLGHVLFYGGCGFCPYAVQQKNRRVSISV